ncbi:MAG: twin-arginine translocase subunit TatC [Coriobacteriia bacterium]|nr:twin-arginine translocase subunit TatC [Coriobacteriia bacterium]
MPIGPGKMPLLGHIGELRRRLTIILAVLSVGTVAMYFFTDPIYRFLLAPVWPILEGGKPIAIGVLDPMTVRFGLSFWAAIVVTSPVLIWQIGGFFLPALRSKERKWVVPTFLVAILLFVTGAAFCYEVILAASFQWLAGQSGDIMAFTPQAGDMLTVVEFFLLGFGVAFQTPIIVFYLVFFGVVPYKTLRTNWRIVYVSTFIIAAGITPDWSPVSMLSLSGAMIVLYEISLALVRIVLAKRIKAREAALAAEEA